MKARFQVAILGWAIYLSIVLACCYSWAFAADIKTVIDSADRKVEFNYPIERIVVTDDTIADAVQLFGKQELVAGVENSIQHRGYFPVMEKRPTIGNQWRRLNWELIVSLKPDVILMPDHAAVTPRVTAKADRLKIPVLVVRWHFPESMDQAVKLLGEVFGEQKRADQFIEWRHRCLGLIADRLKGLPANKKLAAYVEVDISGPIGRAAGRGMPADETLSRAGLINICKFPFSKEVSSEWIMTRNPDIIIMNDYGGAAEITGYLVKDEVKLKEYMNRKKQEKKFKNTSAAQKNQIYVMNSKLRGSMHMAGALYLAKAAYPQLFADIKPEKALHEFFERWLGVPYQGIWFYPMPQNN